MKGHEEASAKALENFLAEVRLSCQWKPAKPDNDFPDFVFEVQLPSGSKKWAVECTDLHQYVEPSGKPPSRPIARIGADKASLKALQRIAKRIEDAAACPPNRRYVLFGSEPPFNLSDDQLVDRALRYIENNLQELKEIDFQPSSDADPWAKAAKDRLARDSSKVWMRALPGSGSSGPRVECIATPPGGMFAPDGGLVDDIYDTALFAVERALKDKLPKLGQCSGYDARVLILWCTFPQTEVCHLVAAVDAVAHEATEGALLAQLANGRVDLIMAVIADGTTHTVADFTELIAHSTQRASGGDPAALPHPSPENV